MQNWNYDEYLFDLIFFDWFLISSQTTIKVKTEKVKLVLYLKSLRATHYNFKEVKKWQKSKKLFYWAPRRSSGLERPLLVRKVLCSNPALSFFYEWSQKDKKLIESRFVRMDGWMRAQNRARVAKSTGLTTREWWRHQQKETNSSSSLCFSIQI